MNKRPTRYGFQLSGIVWTSCSNSGPLKMQFMPDSSFRVGMIRYQVLFRQPKWNLMQKKVTSSSPKVDIEELSTPFIIITSPLWKWLKVILMTFTLQVDHLETVRGKGRNYRYFFYSCFSAWRKEHFEGAAVAVNNDGPCNVSRLLRAVESVHQIFQDNVCKAREVKAQRHVKRASPCCSAKEETCLGGLPYLIH